MREELPRKPRQVSAFVANEFLLDHLEGRLDADRVHAVGAALEKNPETKKKYEQLLLGSAFCRQLNELQPDREFLNSAVSERSFIGNLFQKLRWNSWPDQLRWTSEAFLISCFVALTAYAIPWGQLETWRQTLSERLLARNESNLVAVPEIPPAPPESSGAAQITNRGGAVAAPTAVPSAAPTLVPTVAPTVVPTAAPTAAPKPQGELLRIAMKVSSIENNADEIVAKIKDLGGAKAGQVELGWRKATGNYFHFSLPEENYTALLQFLGGYGSVRMNKTAHARVMPEGQIRVILWIEDGVRPTISESADSPSDELTESTDPDLPPSSGDGE